MTGSERPSGGDNNSPSLSEVLPDRHLTENEVDKLRESDQFKEIYIRGRSIGPYPGTVEELVITLSNGLEKEIGYSLSSSSWELLEPINPEESDQMNCALCNSSGGLREENLAMGWDEYLTSERDFHIFSSVSVPICDSCIGRWKEYRDQDGYGTSGQAASEMLDDLILDNLIQLDDMGNKIESGSSDISGDEV